MHSGSMLISSFSVAILLAACSTTAPQPERSAEAEAQLTKALAGRVAGAPIKCIPTYRADDMDIIDDWTILFKDGGTVYVQNPRGGCPGIANHRNVLVSRPMPSNQLCSGDIQHLFDPVSKIGGGACVFSDFVPYTKAS
ncbi:hypothetical protein LZ496_09225 [Sphingomonas sp. NSE70-1]|uniref:Uncharacterized protein n=1 Tax=Sphingomonas caseinilyticus TaxID=2908205 RepID=A0ABT0RVM5_9SPHN|nr:hypothetical protein [Sphingomonas caseinilyticus]MCL6698961.1 hypothetical protein [Sphingomonas caseinilyticus]